MHAVVYCNLNSKILAETFFTLDMGIFVCQNFVIEIAVHDSMTNTLNSIKSRKLARKKQRL